MELLRITRQIHCKAVEQRATLIHRQYNQDWGTSYSRPPMDPYLTSPLLQNPGGATDDQVHCTCLSVTSRCSWNGWTNRTGFWRGGFLRPIQQCVLAKFGYVQNNGTFLWNVVLNSGLGKFRQGISIVGACYQLRPTSRKVDAQSVINWTAVGQLSWQYLRRSTAGRVVNHSDRQALYTARYRHAGPSATADTRSGTSLTGIARMAKFSRVQSACSEHWNVFSFFPARRYASAGTSNGPVSVCHKSVFSGAYICVKMWVGPSCTVCLWNENFTFLLSQIKPVRSKHRHRKQRRYFCYIIEVRINVDSC